MVNVKIKDLKSEPFNCPFIETPYIEFAREEIEKNPSIPHSGYYRYLKSELDKHKEVFGYIRTEEDILKRCEVWKGLIESIKKGFSPKEEVYSLNGLPYGCITGREKEDGVYLIDGHHRVAILYVLGVEEVNILVFEL